MSETKFTPGPWMVFESKRGPVVEAPGSKPSSRVTVCTIHETAMRMDQNNRAEHDARLIASAPELLEALQAIDAEFSNNPAAPWIPGGAARPLAEQVKTAIAKATGKAGE